MTAPAASPLRPPKPPELDLEDRARILGRVAQYRLAGSTPARLRLWSIATILAMAVTALTSWWAASSLVDSSDRAFNNTAPVLVATQDVFASIAEADAASAAVFLSGSDEDREQRRLYEDALARASEQLEEVSRLVGDDDLAHASIKSIGADLTRYAGLIERARVANQNDLPGASASLLSAIEIVQDGIVGEVDTLTTRAQADLDDDVDGGKTPTIIALLWAAATVVLLLAGQDYIRRQTNRLLNPGLVLATVLIIVSGIWLATAWWSQQSELSDAREGGYNSIELTGEVQTTAFRYKTLESLALLEAADPAEQEHLATRLSAIPIDDAVIADARLGRASGDGLLLLTNRTADSTREQAATSELLVRWDRYLTTSQDIQLALDNGEVEAAIQLAIGPGNSDFNGFNTAVESVLSDNRSQFIDSVSAARSVLEWLRFAMVTIAALAAVLTLIGFRTRINEYYR